jgi:hypothetical protein
MKLIILSRSEALGSKTQSRDWEALSLLRGAIRSYEILALRRDVWLS